MSATAIAVRQEVTQGQSLALMKNCVRAAVNQVCFLRNLFPSDIFKEARYGQTTINVLSPLDEEGAVVNQQALFITQQMEAALEAVDKQYLRSIVFGVYSAEEDSSERELLESYVFLFQYPTEEHVEATLQSNKSAFSFPIVKEEAACLIRKLITLTDSLRTLPANKVVSFKLFYYDENTPKDYQPRLFDDSTDDVHPFFSVPPLKASVGSINSKHHSMVLKVAFREDMEGGEEAAAESTSATATTTTTTATASGGAEAAATDAVTTAVGTLTIAPSVAPSAVESEVSLPLPDGIDSEVYAVAKSLVITQQLHTHRALTQELKTHAGEGGPIEITGQQGRLILKQLEAEGVLVGRPQGRYELAAKYTRSEAHSAAAPAPVAYLLATSTSTSAPAPTHVVPESESALTAAAEVVDRASALQEARILRSRAIVGIAVWVKDQRSGGGVGTAPSYVSVRSVAGMAGCEESVARMLMSKVGEKGVVAAKATPSKGFLVLDGTPAFKLSVAAAWAFLKDVNAVPPHLAAYLEEESVELVAVGGNKRKHSAAASPTAPATTSSATRTRKAPRPGVTTSTAAATTNADSDTDTAALPSSTAPKRRSGVNVRFAIDETDTNNTTTTSTDVNTSAVVASPGGSGAQASKSGSVTPLSKAQPTTPPTVSAPVSALPNTSVLTKLAPASGGVTTLGWGQHKNIWAGMAAK